MNPHLDPSWRGAGDRGPRARWTWNRLLWSLICPQRRQRVMPTISGALLIGISFGVGTAAYNAANNILFITLSLLLGCLIASGVLSWLNFRGLAWQLEVQPPMRVGADGAVVLRVRNEKRFLPTYGLWFELSARTVDATGPARAETTFTARGAEVRAALARAGKGVLGTRLHLDVRLDPGAETELEWILQPPQRGRLRLELQRVGSLFPFGFLRKEFSTDLAQEVVVWPAPVPYRQLARVAARRITGGERAPRSGSGEDLFALRRYQSGDSHRLIHWKASARTRQLLVRQFAAETAEGLGLWVRTAGMRWTGAEQFELALGFAAALAEDLFRAGKLNRLALDAEAPERVRRLQDLESWLDRLAVVPAFENLGARAAGPSMQAETGSIVRAASIVTFVADGARGVAAVAEGSRVAVA